MGNTTDSVNNDGMSPENLEVLEQDESYISGRRGAGVFCDYMTEPIPIFIDANCEKVIDHGNSWIVLGRDRPASRASGYGGQGHTQASSIDIVVGRNPTSTVPVDPSFSSDAARIYISQKSDIDEYFGIAEGRGNAKTKSAIAIKADALRFISREGIKLVTGTDKKNSQGIDIASAQTNMVFATVAEHKVGGLAEHLKQHGILIMAPIAGSLRLVTHLDVDSNAIRTAVETFAEYFA